MSKLISIGVDPGSSNGAVAIIDSNLNILKLTYAPYYLIRSRTKQNKKKLNKETMLYEKDFRAFKWSDYKEIGNILRPFVSKNTDIIYTIERVGSRKGEGEHSSFVFGNSFGIFQGQYSLLNPIKYYEPLPTQWKPELGVTSDKNTSIELAKEIFTNSMKEQDIKIKKSEDDLAEALLIAFYGLKCYIEEIEDNDNGTKEEN